ncbi:hypothetical protein BDQ12DRAFT_679662 [Crucibulum laeve]|uniref:F-box domain-containing protein n=1 Tax=Crucibulum laeve TaxID=68775 RepID=A0A5C3M9Q0_9AGAR|nr:hypothetical protein BDQ12DRAFT_679662 [Crucibulum laeve]
MGLTPVLHSPRTRDLFSSTARIESYTLPPPINTLPPELLIQIFSYYSLLDDLAPATLRAVSKWWLEIVDSAPLLWQTIYLDDVDRSISCSREQSRMWVDRSAPLQYTVELNADDGNNILPLLSPLLPTIDRCHTLKLTGRRTESIPIAAREITPTSLDHLTIYLHDADDEFDLDEDFPPKDTFTPTYEGWQHSYSLNIWVTALPRPEHLTNLSFTYLRISEGIFGNIQTQPRAVLNFLSVCPGLESFTFEGWPHEEDLSDTTPLPIIPLLQLRTLHLKATCSARALLSSIHAPRLRNLYLTHLNVDFRLPGEQHDPGDSTDEAGDFSQSPWSDHATGMGLRKLISRSNPPLRILEMDFSDMRTKDFVWVFERLEELMEFRIVASDMSDRVMKLLRPVRSTEDTSDSGSQHDKQLRLRLPNLRDLELCNCNRLSGDVIADVLRSRVEYTTQLAKSSREGKEHQGANLDGVGIIACEGFNEGHGDLLRRILGKRLRTEA